MKGAKDSKALRDEAGKAEDAHLRAIIDMGELTQNLTQIQQANLGNWAIDAYKGNEEARRKIQALNLSADAIAAVNKVGETAAQMAEANSAAETTSTKFSSYTIPGGENYRELLITLPEKGPQFDPEKVTIKRNRQSATQGSFQIFYDGEAMGPAYGDQGGSGQYGFNTDQEIMESAKRLFDQGDRRNGVNSKSGGYRSGHWDESNVLTHIRFDERQDADGNKVLFINEIQSDWGQEGKKKGFTVKSQTAEDYDITQNDTGLWIGENRNTGVTVGATTRELLEQRIAESAQKERGKTGVPNAPFVTDTKSWTSLAIKRAIRYAAENGFDKIAFANGQQNADLYDLSKQVDQIAVPMVNADSRSVRIDTGQGQSFKLMVGNDGVVTGQRSSDQFTGKTLDEVVGKDMADKIMALDAPSTFSGEGLKVGGEGMRYFYDNLVPSVANDVLKKLGGGRVETVAFGQRDPADFEDAPQAVKDRLKQYPSSQPGFTITPAMREKVMGGLPLFRQARRAGQQKVGAVLGREAVERAATRIGRRLGLSANVSIRTVGTEAELPADIRAQAAKDGATGTVIAVHRGDEIFLVADQHKSLAQVEESILHESNHYGANALFGKAKRQAYTRLYFKLGRADGIRDLAAKQGVNMDAYFTTADELRKDGKISDTQRFSYLVDEFLAHVQGKKAYASLPQKIKTAIQEFYGAIRNWMNQRGFVKLAQFNDADLAYLLRSIHRAAQGNTQPGKGQAMFMVAWHDDAGRGIKREARFSRSRSTKDAYESRIDALLAGSEPEKVTGIRVLDRSDVLDMLGFGDYAVVLAEAHAVRDGMYNHGLTADDWKKIPGWIDDPLAVFERDDGNMTFIAPELKNGSPLIIAIKPDVGAQGRRGGRLHVVLTAFNKTTGKLPIARMISEGGLRFVNLRKSPGFNRGSGLRLPSSAIDLRGLGGKVATEKDLVKYRATHPDAGVGVDEVGKIAQQSGQGDIQEPLQDDLFRQQLDLFLDADVAGQPGPKTQAAKEDAVAAVASLRGSDRGVLGARMADTYAARQRVSLVGHTVNSREDVATLAQVYRDPRFETFRLFFVDQAGKIVSQVGLSSRLPSSSAVFVGPDNQKFLNDLSQAAEASGAVGFYMLHNHPSTNPNPSEADRLLTMRFNKDLNLVNYGHVVLDTNQFGYIDPYGGVEVIKKDFGQVSPFAGNEYATTTINDPKVLIEVAKKVVADKDATTLVVTNAQRRVLGVTTLPAAMLRGQSKALKKMRIRKVIKSMNGSSVFAVSTERPTLITLGGLVTDSIHINEAGNYSSLAEQIGAYGQSDPFVVRGRGVPRVTADTSPEFDYLRDQTLLARGGGMGDAMMVAEPDAPFSARKNVLGQAPLVNWTAPDEAKLDDWIYKLADKQIDTKRVVEKLKASDAWNPYQKETLYHGKAEHETNNFKVNEVKPLLDAMSTRGISIGDLETYLWNRHAPEANDYYARVNPDQFPDGGSGIKTQDALNYLANLPAGVRTDLEAIANQVDAILRETRDILVREGLETQETIDAWEAAYQHYIPLHRESAEISERGMGTGQGFSVKGPASKRRTGSGKAAADILAQVMMQRERVITRAEKNRVALSLYGLAIQNPNPGFWYAVNPDAITQPAKVAQELIDQGMLDTDIAGIIKEPTEARINPRTGLVEHKINPMLRNRPNVLAVRIKGKDRFLFFSTEDARAVRMAESLKNLDAADLGGVWNLFRTVTRYVSSINTQYNPIFGVVNLIRDTQGGLLNLSSTPLAGQQGKVMANIGPALRGIYADLRADRKGQPRSGNEWSKLWEEFQQVGGKTGYRDMFRTAEDRGDALQKELQKAAEGKVKRFGRGVFDWLSDYNETLENAVRLSAYKAGIESGMTKDQSAVLAKDLTVNFNRKGQIASQMGSLYAFFNASAQGSVRLAQTLKGPAGKKIMAGGILLGVMQSVLMAMAGYDDDEPPEFVRERNFILPIGGGKYLTVPYPLGFHALPNMGRVVTDIALSGGRDGSKKVAGLLGSLFETFNPIGSAGWSAQTIAPTFADPLVALSENRDSFGKPIAKEDRSSLSPTPGFSRTKDTASVLSKKLAWGINRLSGGSEYTQGVISPTPDQLDFLFGQVTGGVGREVMKLEQAATSWMSGEELPPYKYPLGVGRFIGNTNAQASDANRFYANLTRLNELEAELKGRAKEGEDVRGFMQDNPEASLVGMANAAETTVTKLRSMKRKMIAAKRPKAEVKQIETRIQSVMKSLNDRVRPMRESPIERALRN
jgi:hypothetical protein